MAILENHVSTVSQGRETRSSTSVQIKISAALFRACTVAQSREETRYYLNGVYVEPHPEGGAVLVATDGHRMIVAHDKGGICKKPAIVALRLIRGDGEIEISDDGIATLGTFRGSSTAFINGTYPDWASVIRPVVELAKRRFYSKPHFEIASFNAKYVADFAKVNACFKDDKVAMQVVSFDKCGPALFLFPSRPHIFGVLMPMRAEEIDPAVPAFMRPILSRKPKKRPEKPAAKKRAA